MKNIKLQEEKESIDNSESENNKKHRPADTDKRFPYNKRIENRHLELRSERRIRNKDRPAIEIYRPGMGRLSKMRTDNNSVNSEHKK